MNFAVANALAFFLQQTLADGPLSNLILAIYFMSKVSSSREYLQVAPVSMDKALTTFTNHENAKIKANVNRVYKNLNSDVNEAIEEGAVATLIAMSLEVLLLATSASHAFNLLICGFRCFRVKSRIRPAMSLISLRSKPAKTTNHQPQLVAKRF